MIELKSGLVSIAVYFVICASLALLLKLIFGVKGEIFRKILHFILLGSLPVFVFSFNTWWIAALTSLLFALIVWPILKMAEHLKAYSRLLEERRGGEIKNSLLLVFGMFALVIAVCWGAIGDRWLVIASVYAWGFGDAAAALVGKKYGQHHIKGHFVDGHKSLEGSLAMFGVSFVTVFAILLLRGGMELWSCIVCAVAAAAVSAQVELCSPGGYDTISCPVAAMIVLLPMVYITGGL